MFISFQIITLFGGYWGTCFAMAFGEMVLASTFATWYWTMNKSEVPNFNLLLALCKTLRYHLGTLAFGSLLLAICKLARDVLTYIESKAKMYDNFVTRAIICLMKGLFWCLEKFLKFFNTNVYIVTAINGTGFCTSAKDAFGLLTRNALRSLALTNVTAFLFFLSKLFLSLGMGACVYQYTMAHELDFEHLNFGFVPALIVAVGTYVICCMFFSVYGMAVDTIFLCFCKSFAGICPSHKFLTNNLPIFFFQ
jgi:solute carrier family 44 (choline transporter-like protein), member 2/4/5